MNEEDEFGMSKTTRDADPMEQENKSAVKDHPDFNFLDADEIRAAVTSEDKRSVPLWMTRMPVEKDPSQWDDPRVENAELDEGYVEDLKRAFSSEMKANMRDLCIPLESYAYDQEFACALLIGLLEPSLKKYGIKLTDTPTEATEAKDVKEEVSAATVSIEGHSINEDEPALNEEKVSPPHEPETLNTSPSPNEAAASDPSKLYGEVVSELVQNLWRVCKEDCEVRLRAKIDEKQQQVTARVEAVQSLRTRAIRAIMEANLIYRTMVPVFAHTTVVPFEDVVNVVQTTSFGIQVVSMELDSSKHGKGITIAMGLEVDLLYQLLHELFSMHQKEIKANTTPLPPLQQQETEKNPAELKKILGSEEEETKEDDVSPTNDSVAPANADGGATVASA
ncbi:hypothetical protein AM588_10002196 [Phytophthora nicotianae]|uniref:Uncharacterized protein n=1 Tax=Phytophthora nicotianae TaxID=4792 RepID=A0A0W8CYX7_PHYNI|nr:hypothetical protein AM588_10002196 [Phytophthora nicotianae]